MIPATLSSLEPHPNRSLGNKGFQESVSTEPLTFKCVSPPGGNRSCAALLLCSPCLQVLPRPSLPP